MPPPRAHCPLSSVQGQIAVRPKFPHVWPASAQNCQKIMLLPCFPKLRRQRPKVGRVRARDGRIPGRARSRIWPNSAQTRLHLADSGPTLAENARLGARHGQTPRHPQASTWPVASSGRGQDVSTRGARTRLPQVMVEQSRLSLDRPATEDTRQLSDCCSLGVALQRIPCTCASSRCAHVHEPTRSFCRGASYYFPFARRRTSRRATFASHHILPSSLPVALWRASSRCRSVGQRTRPGASPG